MLHHWIRQIKKWLGERRGVSPPVMLVTDGLSPRRSPRRRLNLEPLEDRINPNATLNILGGGIQIVIAGQDTVNLSTVNGDLVVNDSTAGQTITDNTGKFTVAGAAGNQTATENASLVVDFASLTITGTGGGQTVNFTGGSFVATNVNDSTIATVGFVNAASTFSGPLNILSSTSLTVNAAVSGTDTINIIVGGTNAALDVNANVTSQYGEVTLQATGSLNVGTGVAIVSATGPLSLGADLMPASNGDDGIGTLTVNAGASLYGTGITLRGADVDIAPNASVGSAMATESVVSTFVDNTQGLSEPGGPVFDSSGNLYVNNELANTISKVTPGGTVTTFASSSLFRSPMGLAFDNSDNLYVANFGNNTISKVTQNGVASTFVDNTHGLAGPTGLAFDRNGNLFISNSGINTISKVTPAGVVSTFVDNSHGLAGPFQLAFDQAGILYVANGGAAITKVTPNGVTSTVLDSSQGLKSGHSLAFDGSGNLYASSGAITPQIIEVSAAGIVRGIPLYTNNVNGTPNLGSFAFDASGNLFFADLIANTIDKTTTMSILATTSQITIRSSVPSRPMSLGGSNNAAVIGINLTSAELATIATTASGTVTFGDSDQTGNITIATATLATIAGVSAAVMESPIGGGKIILDDGVDSASALNGNGGTITLTAGTGGIAAASVNNNTAEIATTGTSVTFNTTGPIGTITNRIQFGDAANATQQIISIGTNSQPSSVYLDGLGSLTLGSILGAPGAPIDVTARTKLVVANNATITSGDSAFCTMSLGADLTPAGVGDNGIGTLTISAGATLYGTNINLRGADEDIDPTATVGYLGSLPAATLAGVFTPQALAFDGNGNLYVANYNNGGAVSEFAPGSTTATATLNGLDAPRALAFDSGSNLFVANYGNNTVSEFAPGATTPTATLTGLNFPDALAFDASGNLYVGNTFNTMSNGTISKFSPGATTPSATLTMTGTMAGTPVSLAFDSSGNLYVANQNSVIKFSPGATSPSANLSGGLSDPNALAFDNSGNLFVTNGGGHTVAEFAPGSTAPSATLTGLTYPGALGFDASGNLYVANFYGGSVSKFSPGSTTPSATLTGLAEPIALTLDKSGNLYVANIGPGTVSKFIFNSPMASTVTIHSSLPSRPMNIGGTNNAAVPGINLTSGELARIFTASNGSITVGDGSQMGNITFNGTIPTTTSGAFVLNAGSGSITVAGNSTLPFAGGNFNASTLIDNGTVPSNVNVNNGQALMGTGFTGPVTVQSGGAFFSSTTVSTLTSASLNLQPGSSFNAVLNSTNNYSGDLVVPTGTVSLGGANLLLSGTLTPADGQSFFLVNNAGSQPVSGTFDGLPEGAVIPNFLGSSLDATISYVGGDGNDVVLKVGTGATTTATVIASAGTVIYGQQITMTAIVTASAGTPTGNVEFFDATTGADLGPGTLQSSGTGSGTWAYTTSPTQLQVRGGSAYTIMAVYSSSSGFFGNAGIQTGTITVAPANLTITGVTASNKVYNQTTSVTIQTSSAALVGIISGDTITLGTNGATGTFASKDVANNIAVTAAGLTISGPQVGNYTLTQPTTIASITPVNVGVSGITANNKVYDHTTAATLNLGNAVVQGVFG